MTKRKGQPVKRITRRWIFNSFVVIVGIVLAVVLVVSFMIQRSYYSQVDQALLSQADSIRSTWSQLADKPSGQDITYQIRDSVASFEGREKMELMVVNTDRDIISTSSGFMPEAPNMPDLDNAILEPSGLGKYVGKLGTEDRVLAISVLYPLAGQQAENDILALRLVTSLSQVDKQIAASIATITALGIAALALVLFSSSYFLNSIIRPIGEVGDTARLIAQGDFATRIEKTTDDEIGELVDIINYMAEELQQTEQLKNDFISSVSHELRTPLTAIQGWGETIRFDAGNDPELLERGMDVIIGETHRLSDMVEELLDFSRMQSGRLKLVRTRIDVIAELDEAVLMYTQRAKRDGITMLYKDTDEIAIVNGDKNRLRQVFINVIDNAIKYSDAGDTVTISTEITPDTIRIIINDTGIGISPRDLPQVKSKFYKANSTRRGSGIGLAVADEIVTRHDGFIEIESVEGEGTTLAILLPLYQKQEVVMQIDDLTPKTPSNLEKEDEDDEQ